MQDGPLSLWGDEEPDPIVAAQNVDEGWFIDRRSLFTDEGLTWFQVFYQHDGEKWDRKLQIQIGESYRTLQGISPPQTHKEAVNSSQTMLKTLERMGTLTLEKREGNNYLIVTPLGRQVHILLQSLPHLYVALPRLILQVLVEYQMYNPTLPAKQTRDFAIFPYWFTFYVMRHCDNYLTDDEFLRFVYKARHTDQADEIVDKIHSYREMLHGGASKEELDKLATALDPERHRRNYFLQPLKYCEVILTEGSSSNGNVYRLHPMFYTFIDTLLTKRPHFRGDLTRRAWMALYGRSVPLQPPPRQVKVIQVTHPIRALSVTSWIVSPQEIYSHSIAQDDLLYFLYPRTADEIHMDISRWIFQVIAIHFEEPVDGACTVELRSAWLVTDPNALQSKFRLLEEQQITDSKPARENDLLTFIEGEEKSI